MPGYHALFSKINQDIQNWKKNGEEDKEISKELIKEINLQLLYEFMVTLPIINRKKIKFENNSKQQERTFHLFQDYLVIYVN